ncbi:MAG: NUDIX hydrolase [Muribaculaceae bacterium]
MNDLTNSTTDGGKKMYCYKYPHPALTVDCVIFGFDGEKLNVLLVERGLEPFKGMWALPGGFVNIDETVEDAARRELMEETGIADMFLEQFKVFSAVHRDPRERVVTVAFLTLVSQDKCGTPRAGSDANMALWFDESKLPPLAFDHREIIEEARRHLSDVIRLRPVAFRLLNKVFTVAELQRVYEIINRTQYDRRNFQRKLLQSDILDDQGIAEVRTASRPPRLYSLKPEIEREAESTETTDNDSIEPICACAAEPEIGCCDCDGDYDMAEPGNASCPDKASRNKKDDGFSLRRLFEW